MRLFPAQIAINWICGEELPHDRMHPHTRTIKGRIREGHRFMVSMTGQDFGYDLQTWHDYLKESRDGGYTYGRNIVLPKIMQKALASPEWQQAVRCLSGDHSTCDHGPHDDRFDEDPT